MEKYNNDDIVERISELAQKTFANDFEPKMSYRICNTYAWMGAPIAIDYDTHEMNINIRRKTNANKINAFIRKVENMGVLAYRKEQYGKIVCKLNKKPITPLTDQRRTEPTTDGPQTNFDALLGTDISKLKNRLGYWWRLDNGIVNEAGIGLYKFTRPGRGMLHVQADKNKISYISGWSLDKVV